MNIGLYFGSFNPIHIGHLILANHIAEYSNLDQVWFVVTPHNPFKQKSSLLNDYLRLEMVQIAIEDYPKLKASDIEFKLPQPNYTINTLSYLEEKYPKYNFSLIMGEDNLESLHKWKNFEILLQRYSIFVYPRLYDNKQESELLHLPNIHKTDAPIIELSSTFIRKAIKERKNVQPLLPEKVWKHIDKNLFYR
ncbi:MAG: nicotinate (nicotinamide) nucleotide adenylyltransferase [Bacteroidota bacterium]|nr:nicotinate (nicotinamide) nucleotide adenylyltransferase [Bacteroidota bacterium]